MTDITKQQEFLESLKDPTGAALSKASREFNNNYPSVIEDIQIQPLANGDYAIHVYANKIRILVDTERSLLDLMCKHAKGIMIHVQLPIKEFMNGTFVKTYYASWSIR